MTNGQVRFGIKTRLILLIGLVISLLVVAMGIFSYQNTKRVVESGIAREAQSYAANYAEAISNWFKSIEDEMYLFSIIPEVRNFELDEARTIMANLVAERPAYGGILLADTSGSATTVEGLTIDISARDYFIQALATGKVFYSEPMITQGTNQATIMVARPIFAERGNLVGVVAFSVTLDYMQQVAESATLAGYGHGWLISDSGVIVGHPVAEYVGNADLFKQHQTLQPILAKMLAGESSVENYSFEKQTRLIAYAPISQNG